MQVKIITEALISSSSLCYIGLMVISWGSGGLPPEKFSLDKLPTMPEDVPSQDRRNGKSS